MVSEDSNTGRKEARSRVAAGLIVDFTNVYRVGTYGTLGGDPGSSGLLTNGVDRTLPTVLNTADMESRT